MIVKNGPVNSSLLTGPFLLSTGNSEGLKTVDVRVNSSIRMSQEVDLQTSVYMCLTFQLNFLSSTSF